ncbi:hypothetical protein J3R30DRAFT_3660876 [Lentinula aciculospora]|uniref:Peptidase S54 rhomboid domain-containing protein n=1 Tax=Lentinula aciculospora TaxID=153920 RepID=A0A9W9DHU8_9AGAR|nr:hypothetical protein J3R30DRAFT_3660876 [Lentinula aciculospora]
MLRLHTKIFRANGLLRSHFTRNFLYPRPLISLRSYSLLKIRPLEQTAETFANSVRPSIRNQVLFFLFGSSSILLYSAWATNIETAIVLEKLKTQSSVWQVQSIANVDLRRFQQMELVKNLRSTYKYLNTQAAEIPQLIRPYLNAAYVALLQPYADASEGRRLCWKICLLNTGVWLMWQFQRLQPMMNRAFVHQPLSGLTYTMLSSIFSHSSLLYLAFNCLALEGFGFTLIVLKGSAATTYLRQAQDKNAPGQLESTSSYHFLSFYISAGVFASLASHIANARIRYPKLIAQLSSPASRPPATETWASAVAAVSSATAKSATAAPAAAVTIPGSLGASGAVYACVTLVALAYPESQVSLIFPPVTPIGIQTAAMGILTLDMIGIYRGWRIMDHWAHLGGAAFGALYYYYGPYIWSQTRAAL